VVKATAGRDAMIRRPKTLPTPTMEPRTVRRRRGRGLRTQRLQQMRGRSNRRLRQPLIPLAEHLLNRSPSGNHLVDLAVHFGRHASVGVSDVTTRRASRLVVA
jgi:hypothetical protein